MNPKSILTKIERAIPFTNRQYPGYEALTPEQGTIFALRHMGSHQAKVLRAYPGANDSYRSMLVFKLSLNSFRFAQVAGIQEGELNRRICMWERVRIKRAFTRFPSEMSQIDLFKEGALENMALFEPIDHGDPLDTILPQIRVNALNFLELSNNLARVRGDTLTLDAFIRWIDGFMTRHPA